MATCSAGVENAKEDATTVAEKTASDLQEGARKTAEIAPAQPA